MQLKRADKIRSINTGNRSDRLPHRYSGRISPPDVSAACPRPGVSSVWGVCESFGLGWFGGVITRRVHKKSMHDHDCRVMLKVDRSARSMKLPLKSNSTDVGAGVGAWLLLDVESREVRSQDGR